MEFGFFMVKDPGVALFLMKYVPDGIKIPELVIILEKTKTPSSIFAICFKSSADLDTQLMQLKYCDGEK